MCNIPFQVCSVIGLLSFNINCIMQIVANHRHLSQITWGFVMTTLLLPLLGWGGANLLAWMFQQSIQKRRTIGVEILMHNVALTVVILGTAFYNFEHKLEIAAGLALQGPISGLYGLLMVFIFSFLHRSHSEAAGRMPRVELPNLSGNGSVINHDDGDVRTQPVVQESNKANIATYLQQETVKGGITESALWPDWMHGQDGCILSFPNTSWNISSPWSYPWQVNTKIVFSIPPSNLPTL